MQLYLFDVRILSILDKALSIFPGFYFFALGVSKRFIHKGKPFFGPAPAYRAAVSSSPHQVCQCIFCLGLYTSIIDKSPRVYEVNKKKCKKQSINKSVDFRMWLFFYFFPLLSVHSSLRINGCNVAPIDLYRESEKRVFK